MSKPIYKLIETDGAVSVSGLKNDDYLGLPVMDVPAFPAYLPDANKPEAIIKITGTNPSWPEGVYCYNAAESAWKKIAAGPLTTDDIAEGTNPSRLYFGALRVLNTLLVGLSFGSMGVITTSDSIISAFGKLQAQISFLMGDTISKSSTGTQTIAGGTLSIAGEFISTYGGRIAHWLGSVWRVDGGGYIDLSNGGAGGTQIAHSTKSVFITSNVGTGIGGETKTIEAKGNDLIRVDSTAKTIWDDTAVFGKNLAYYLVPDSSYAPANPNFDLELPTITANCTITLSAGNAGQPARIWNKNTGSFAWNLAGTVLKDQAGNVITSLENGIYNIRYKVSFWQIQSQSSRQMAFKSVAAYADMIADGTPVISPITYEVLADENKSYARSTYIWKMNGNREWLASTPDN